MQVGLEGSTISYCAKPTNKKVDIDGVTLVRMENGKIAEERDFIDNLEFMQQLGLIPRQ